MNNSAPVAHAISGDELADQVMGLGLRLDRFEKIVVLGGESYVEMVRKAFRGREIINPLSGCTGKENETGYTGWCST